MLADFEERVEVFEPPLIPRSSHRRNPRGWWIAGSLPLLRVWLRLPAPTVEYPGCSGLRLPRPHPRSPGASSVSQPAAAAVPGESVGAVESSSSGDGADWPLADLLKESGRLLWAYGIGEASEYAMHLACSCAPQHCASATPNENASPGCTRTRPTREMGPDAPPDNPTGHMRAKAGQTSWR